ncbi:hypothetical protein E2C01_038942 [Portunus trituberculatus]|uniref:Uncharacterized protein n=1 Tax=Portunus trituberculatus TaxID=210409 RepID=A0A5B7FJV4_PORTR|nr:hypothetical protein [Portunus trituberculatus]
MCFRVVVFQPSPPRSRRLLRLQHRGYRSFPRVIRTLPCLACPRVAVFVHSSRPSSEGKTHHRWRWREGVVVLR